MYVDLPYSNSVFDPRFDESDLRPQDTAQIQGVCDIPPKKVSKKRRPFWRPQFLSDPAIMTADQLLIIRRIGKFSSVFVAVQPAGFSLARSLTTSKE